MRGKVITNHFDLIVLEFHAYLVSRRRHIIHLPGRWGRSTLANKGVFVKSKTCGGKYDESYSNKGNKQNFLHDMRLSSIETI